MPANILSGKTIADEIKAEVAEQVASLQAAHGFAPCLVVVRVGEDPASSVYVGSSNIVVKPMAMLLLHENATVTICHSRTRDLPAVTKQADILVRRSGVRALFAANTSVKMPPSSMSV